MNQQQKKYAIDRIDGIRNDLICRVNEKYKNIYFDELSVIVDAIADGSLVIDESTIIDAIKKRKSLYGSVYLYSVFGLTYDEYNHLLNESKCKIDNSEVTKKRDSIVKRINDKVTRLKDEIILGAEGKDVLKKIAELENFKI